LTRLERIEWTMDCLNISTDTETVLRTKTTACKFTDQVYL